jgi:pyruvate formate lyase activating enzyme
MSNILYKVKGDKIQCLLCPNLCLLNDGQFGICKTRKRENDKIINPYSGVISSSGIDPMEKKPLYHFFPGSAIFSVGFFGCTLKCQFCQNYSISQFHPEDYNNNKLSPEDVVYLLKEKNIKSIAFTYSEPLLYHEWVLKTSILCRKNNIKTVLVTNGFINQEPAEEILEYIDAANIDLKSSKNDFYKKICSGKVESVKEFIRTAFKKKVHIEVTTLVITDTNDSIEEFNEITDFISSISEDIPFHISRYHPSYNFNKEATPIKTLEKLIEFSQKKLNYVYGGNMLGYSDTLCKKCNEILIKRDFYTTSIRSLDKNGNCKKCGSFNNFIVS